MRQRSVVAARPRSRRQTSLGLDLDRFKEALADGAPITVACTQEAPLFREVAENSPQAELTFVNIRETGGWSKDAAAAGPKAAALIAAAGEDMPPISLVTLESSGVALIRPRQVAIEAAQRLADRLDIPCFSPGPATSPAPHERISRAQGHHPQCARTSRAVRLAIDDYALPSPSSRAKLVFGPSRNGATSTCDLILDLSAAHRCFPRMNCVPAICAPIRATSAAVERAIADAGGLVGTSTSRALSISSRRCARIRALRSPDVRAARSVSDRRDHAERQRRRDRCQCVRRLRLLRFGMPTGAASYALPSADALMRRLRTLLQTYRKAGGSDAVILFHDGEHGEDIIDALARFGEGLPANVLPLRVNEVTQLGPELLASVFAYGGSGVALLTRARPRHDIRHSAARSKPRIASLARWVSDRHHSDHRDRRSGPVARHAGCRPSRRHNAKAGRLRATGRETRRARNDFSRTSPGRPAPVESCRWRRVRPSAP